MKKLILMLLVLVGGVVQMQAAKTIYFTPGVWNADGAWYALYFNTGDNWVAFNLVDDEKDIYSAEVPDEATIIIAVRMNSASSEMNWENKWNQTGDITEINDNMLITITGWDSDSYSCTYNSIATIDKVQLYYGTVNGSDDNMLTLTKGDGYVYTGTLDLSSTTANQKFKLVVNDGGDAGDNWAGWIGRNKMTINIPDGWLDYEGVDDNSNLILKNWDAEYKTYNITATWEPNSIYSQSWTLKIEGVTPRPRVYSIVGTLTGGWDTDCDMTATGEEGVYQYVVDEVVLNAGDYEYKLRTNHGWGKYDLPESGNETYTCPANGKYKLTFTANLNENTLALDAEKLSEAVTITSAGWATAYTKGILNFSAASVEAYTATVNADKTRVSLNKVTDVQEGTGLVLKGAEGTHYIPVAASSTTDKGDLKVGAYTVNDSYAYCYGLYVSDGTAKFAKIKHGESIPAGKVFLELVGGTSARELDVEFSNGTTGISEVKGAKVAAEGCYNLAGQRVAQPAKGLYIIGGKKVIVK